MARRSFFLLTACGLVLAACGSRSVLKDLPDGVPALGETGTGGSSSAQGGNSPVGVGGSGATTGKGGGVPAGGMSVGGTSPAGGTTGKGGTSPAGGNGAGGSVPKPCGDGTCAANEDCTSCPHDCGLCKSCGDFTCDNGETCSSCPGDCGVCTTGEVCGDGFCKGAEDCLSCAPDCDVCPGCGDGKCDPKTENCFSCPKDCGKCPDCPTGTCDGNKTCASCAADCGVCSVCGNNKCEPPYETCTNCQDDCGMCETIGCFKVVTCSLKCINVMSQPPMFSVSCLSDCVSLGCADVQFFVDQVLNCVIAELIQNGPGGGVMGALAKCDKQLSACFAATCN